MYSLESYDANDAPADRKHIMRGEFRSRTAALDAAKRFIDDQLRRAVTAGLAGDAAFREWRAVGEIPVIVAVATRAEQVEFDPIAYAAPQAQLIAQGIR